LQKTNSSSRRKGSGDRRKGSGDRRRDIRLLDFPRIPSWMEQRAQHLTRYAFCFMALYYFNVAKPPTGSGWFSLTGINTVFLCYSLVITISMLSARKKLYSLLRWRAAMLVDLSAAACAILADAHVLSPGFLVFLMVILGNGMRYGMRVFAEAVIGSFAFALLALGLRWSEFTNALSVEAIFASLFLIILVLYSYSLMARLESRKRRLELERNRDELTGLFNRRALFEHTAHFYDHCKTHLPAAVLFFDLDGFKSVNDTHGHHKGDWVLAEIGAIMSRIVRKTDLVARYGGDEFVMVLVNADIKGGEGVARRLQHEVQIWSSRNNIDLSLSIGLGQTPEHGSDLKTVIQHVDQAMYQGRNDLGPGAIQLAAQATESCL